ncbi:hypothetical protein [Microbacterium oleivorans]|uniref:DUF732 domain-containing protein n=1 Tax=Microbacterium oleivorans TaxID=273677 RepID=A0A7D5JEV2_9MICO|nr:hypothetical protein [Microbacterium oleivorans]QLD11378.1 hypothetical protein HW566_06070 [Microbacterium oleivorans]
MKRAAHAATAAVLVAVLGGCSAPAVDEPIESAEPLIAEAPSAEASSPLATDSPAHWGDMTAQEFYLASLAGTWWGGGEPNDTEWLAAGYTACEEIAAGADPADVRPLGGEGEDADENNRVLVKVAENSLCYLD